MLCNGDRTRRHSKLSPFSATTRSSRWGRNEWSPGLHLLSEEHACCTCYNIWSSAMGLCLSPLFISFPCAHPKIILPFREETMDQNSYSKQDLSLVSPGLTVSTSSYCPCRDSPAWTFCMCSDRIDAVMVCEAEGPPIMRVYYFCWEHSQSWLQGGLKSCQVWIQNEVSGRFLRHTLRSMLQGLSRVHSGVPRFDALWCLLK